MKTKETKYTEFLQMEKPTRHPGGEDEHGRFELWDIGMVRNAPEHLRKRMKVYTSPAPHVILDQNIPLRGWYKSKRERPTVRPRPCYTEAFLTQPYGGACPGRCVFCYVNNGLRGYRGQGVTVVDPGYPDKIRKQLSRLKVGAAFYISSFTEPFQKLEDVFHNTQRTAQVAVDAGLPLFFLTRQVPPGWAFDILRKNRFSYQQFSINTPNSDDWKRLSPGAAPLFDLFEAIRECKRFGIYVSIQVNPILSGIVSSDHIVELIHLLAEAGADHCIFKHVEIVSPSAKAMVARLHRLFPDRSREFQRLFTETIGGLRTIRESYRRKALDRYLAETKKAGITMGLCYEYKYRRDGNGKITDKTGVSLGPEYTTGAQCHGPEVPVFRRSDLDKPFEPFEGCSPGGCLYCEEVAGAPCGNDVLRRAKALKPSDLRTLEIEVGGKT